MEAEQASANLLTAGIHAQLFATTLLGKLPTATKEQRASLTPMVRALDLAFPQQMDAAVNQVLQHSQGDEQAAAQQVFELLQAALAGSARAPLSAAGSTLALAVDAPSAEMRIQVSGSHCCLECLCGSGNTAEGEVCLPHQCEVRHTEQSYLLNM